MRKHPSRLATVLVLLGLAAAGVVAAVALAAGSPPASAPPLTGTPAGTLTIGGATFPVSSSQMGWGVGIGRSTSGPVEVSNVSISEFTLTKPSDANSVLLMNKLVSRTAFPGATLTLSWNGGTWTWEMTDVYVSGLSQSTGGGQPSDSFSLNFATVGWKHASGGVITQGQYP